MTLYEVLKNVIGRFRPNHPSAPANTFVFGFITPNESAISLIVSREHAEVTPGVFDAEYLVYGTSAMLKALFNPDYPNRAEVVAQLEMRPAYPFNNYLLSIVLNALDLAIPDLDYVAKRFDGPYPFPPRYPAAENPFRQQKYEPAALPAYNEQQLPALVAEDHPVWVEMYNKAWRLAFKNLRQPEPASGFIANFIDPAFNANTFMWDSCFMTMFGRYGRRIFPFMGTLDNFYAKQHDDGFICREINTYSGASVFQSLDPRSTGPNIMAWTERIYYEISDDLERLHAVFPGLIAFHRWWKDWRTHPDGSYWTSGWGSGMDNQTRVPRSEYHHRGYSWVDATLQQALNCQSLLWIGEQIGRHEFDGELNAELNHMEHYLNTQMWDETIGFYLDRAPDGSLSQIKSIGALWGLLTDAVPAERAEHLMEHLDNPNTFKRPHRVPTQAYDSPDYNPYAGYWLGGVWSPTNYMTLRGLTSRGAHDLAYAIAFNHVENVAQVFEQTGTLWENYSPEFVQPGKPAGRDFVGWTGVSAISVPLEYLIGVRSTNGGANLHWDIRLTERHGVLRYPLGASATVDLICAARAGADAPPLVIIRTDASLDIQISFNSQQKQFMLSPGEHQLQM